MGSKASTPAAPDYTAAANAQGAANLTAAQQTGVLSNPNVNSPYGNQAVSYANVADPNDPTKNFLQPTVTQTLTPQAQQTLNAQQQVQTGEANLGLQGLSTAQQVMGTPFSFGGPGVQTSIGNSGYIQGAANPYPYNAATNVNGGSIQGAPNLASFGQAGANVNGGNINQGPSGSQFGTAQGGVSAPNLQSSIDTGGVPSLPQQGGVQSSLNTSGVQGIPTQGPVASSVNTSNIAQMPVNAGTTGQAAIESRLAPLQARQMQSEQTQLANQGLVPGDEAYSNAMTDFTNQQNDAQQQAVLNGLNLDMSANNQGFGQNAQQASLQNQAQSQLYSQGLASNQQGMQNALNTGNFANQAQAQQFGQGLQANQAGFQNALQSGQFGNAAQLASFGAGLQNQQAGNSAIGQNFGQSITAQQAQNTAQQQAYSQQVGVAGLQNQAIAQNQQAALSQQTAANAAQQQGYAQNLQSGQFYNQGQQQNYANQQAYQQNANAAQAQTYNQNLQSGQFANTAQQQALAQALNQYNLPLNQINSLMSGSQIQSPQFTSYTGANVAPAPIANAATQQANYNQGLYGLQQGAANQNTAAIGQLGSAALMAFALSDRRLKSNIKRIGTHPLGIGVYEYDILGRHETGVMADEVMRVKPEAVGLHPSGYMMVDYGRL